MSWAPGCRKWWSQLRTNAAQLQKREVISLGSESYQGYMQTGASIWLPEKHSGRAAASRVQTRSRIYCEFIEVGSAHSCI